MYVYDAKVVRVIDGDTAVLDIDLGFKLTMQGEIVRFYGINAPESRTTNLDEKKRGMASKEFLKSILHPGDSVLLQSNLFNKRGKYGRTVGTIIANGKNINELMVSEGYAVHKEY